MGELLFYIAVGAASRLLPHPSNMTAIGAVAVFSGARRGVIRGTGAAISAMLISDLVLGLHPLTWATYGSVFLGVVMGRIWARSRKSGAVAGTVVASSLCFYLVTNFAVWQQGLLYPRTVEGLIACYAAGLPFFRNSLFGDAVWSTVLFGAEAVMNRVSSGAARMRHSFA